MNTPSPDSPEEAHQRERDRLQTLMDHLPDVIFIKDRVGRFLMTNPALNRLYGCESSEELAGKTDFDFIPEEVAGHFAEDDQRVMNSGKPLVDREESNVGPHGEVLWMLTSKIPLRDADGKVTGLVGIGRDITKLKKAQQAATRKATEAGLLYQATSLARDTDSLEEALRGCLALVCDLTDWDIGHVFRPADEESLRSTGIWHACDEPQLAEFRRLAEGASIKKGQGLAGAVWESGEPRWLARIQSAASVGHAEVFDRASIQSAVAFPINIRNETVAVLEFFAFEEQPRDEGILSIFQSVGEQVGRVIERRRNEKAVKAALAAADAANRAKSDFLANVSHEIRTPMNGVIGMTELLLETELTPTQREYLEMVQTSGESLLDLINDILDFSKIEAGRMELDPADFNFRDSLGDTMKLLGTRAHRQGLELAFSIDDDVPEYLFGDAARLRQIVVNLVGNAIKFTKQGEVVLRVTRVGSAEDGVRLKVTVADTGIGIPSDRIEDIFSAFQQVDTSTTRSYGGTGLGLAICTRLVEMMGGRIECSSEVGKGSLFSFEVDFAAATDHHVQKRNPVVVHGTRTLIVDDNATNRRILQEMCTNWGMAPVVANSAEAAMRILADCPDTSPFSLVLTDVNMPEQDGFDLCRRIRADSRFTELKIIMLTSAGRHGDADRRRELNVADHLLKPVKQSELFDSMVSVLGVTDVEDAASGSSGVSEGSQITGLRVLLAEDNLVNQKLALGLLKKQGHQATLACNGAEAVQACREADFDVVLMDIQMPEMDGFEATAAILKHERQTGKKTPIVAMTAHAMKGDRDRCLEAGMDEYLSKPIRGRQIAEMFAKLRLQPAVSTGDTGVARSDSQDDGGETELINWKEALAGVDGDRELLKAVIDAFAQEAPALLDSVQTVLESGDSKTLHRTGHTIKGSLLSLGAPGPAELAKKLELIGAAGSTEGAAAIMEELSQQMEGLLEELQSFTV